MNNKILIGIFVVIFLSLGGAGISWFKNNVATPPKASNTDAATEVNASASTQLNQQTTLKDLWSSGVSQKCTFADGNTTGVTYISDGKMKGDFTSVTGGQTTTTHMIVEGKTSYIWMENQSQGYKVPIENISQQIGASSSGTIDLNRQFNVQCQSEDVKDSKFNIPQNIQFQDMSQVFQTQSTNKASSSASLDIKAMQCGACDKLPDGAKDQCKKALSC